MRLQLVEDTIITWLRRILLWVILCEFILVYFIEKKVEIKPWQVFIVVAVTYFVRVILYVLFDPNRGKGFINLDSNGKFSIIIGNNNETGIIQNLTFYYSGYAGKPYPVWYFFSLKNLHDGSQNILKINGKTFKILLTSKEEWNHLRRILDDLHEIGIRTDIFKFLFIKELRIKSKPRKILTRN